MPKKVSKTDIVKEINKLDVLEVIQETVLRSDPAPHRQAKISAFTKKAKEQVADDRDVLLISIKIK